MQVGPVTNGNRLPNGAWSPCSLVDRPCVNPSNSFRDLSADCDRGKIDCRLFIIDCNIYVRPHSVLTTFLDTQIKYNTVYECLAYVLTSMRTVHDELE